MMETFIFYFFVFLLGAGIGSFLNVLIDRLPNEESIFGRSHCDHCKKTLAWYDLVPVLSFVWLRGKCRYCRKRLSWQYPVVEMLTGIAFLLIFLRFNRDSNVINLLVFLGIISTLIVIFFADLKYRIIPDSMQVSLLIFSLGMKLIPLNSIISVLNGFRDGVIVMAPILLLFLLTRGRGMGFADVKLAFVMGVMLGVLGGFVALYIGFVIGAIVGAVLIVLRKKKMKSKIAFGPFLVIGILVMLFFGQFIETTVRQFYQF